MGVVHAQHNLKIDGLQAELTSALELVAQAQSEDTATTKTFRETISKLESDLSGLAS